MTGRDGSPGRDAIGVSLATEAFPGLNEEGVRALTTARGTHRILLLPHGNTVDSDGVPARVEAWLAAGGEAERVRALHVGIADPLTAGDLRRLRERLPAARLLTNFGVGLNHVDLATADTLGFEVTNTPDVLTDATADVALLLLLLITRDAVPALVSLRADGRYEGWKPVAAHMGRSLAGRRLGIVGYGRIGTAFALRARALGMEVVALASSHVPGASGASGASGAQESNGADVPRLDEGAFLSTCDVISLHCPLTARSRGWLSRERLARMKDGAVVVNTARGEVVDERALADALASGRLAGAGLDVFVGEPVLSDALRSAPRHGSWSCHTWAAPRGRRGALWARSTRPLCYVTLAAHRGGKDRPGGRNTAALAPCILVCVPRRGLSSSSAAKLFFASQSPEPLILAWMSPSRSLSGPLRSHGISPSLTIPLRPGSLRVSAWPFRNRDRTVHPERGDA